LIPPCSNAYDTNPEQSKRPAFLSAAVLPPPQTYVELPMYLFPALSTALKPPFCAGALLGLGFFELFDVFLLLVGFLLAGFDACFVVELFDARLVDFAAVDFLAVDLLLLVLFD